EVRVGCVVGYTGFFKLQCMRGRWQSIGKICQRKSCGHPGDAQFADFILEGEDFVFGSQVVYTCHKGYQMVSRRNTRRCMEKGWDGTIPVCEALQCPAISADNNVQMIGDADEANYGNVLRFTCRSSNEILYGSQQIYCNEHGQWSDETPKCREVTCPVPVIENGYVLGNIQEYKQHEYLEFECNPTYKRSEARDPTCTRTGPRAEWSPTPVCERKCKLSNPNLLFPTGGASYDPPYRNVFPPGERVKITCGDRYYISRPQDISAVATCKDDGEWTFQLTCREVTCNRPRDPTLYDWRNWEPRLKLLDTVRYSCKGGYKRTDGATEATCTRDGWSPNPLCQEITCNRRDFHNADVEDPKQTYRDGEHASYVCKEGYRGSFYLTCGKNGWSGQQQCKLHTECQKPDVQHGFIVGPYNETLYYTCEEGYKLVTKPWWGEAKCGSTEALAQCIEKSACGELPVIPHMEVESQRNNYTHGESVTINCKEGYVAQFVRLTCHQGKWNDSETSLEKICQRDHCVPPPKVTNAVVVTSRQKEYTSGSEATYQCRDQYTIKGVATVTCINGTWEERNFTCTRTYIQMHLKLLQMLYERVQLVQFHSNLIFFFFKLAAMMQDNFEWRMFVYVLLILCVNTIYTNYQTEYTSGSKVTYQCRDHYTMEGVGRITCINGQWEEEKFTCSPTGTYIQKHLKLLQMLYERVQLVQFHSNLIFFFFKKWQL
uniref:Complement factor H n=1 Tax=Seriola lalandi dorsalis TaxID=1841481 RepID=A0A3B4XWK4_SERLL